MAQFIRVDEIKLNTRETHVLCSRWINIDTITTFDEHTRKILFLPSNEISVTKESIELLIEALNSTHENTVYSTGNNKFMEELK